MGCSGDDVSSELAMIIDNYTQLQEKNPEHELLGLIEIDSDKWGMKFKNGFWEKCGREGHHQIHAFMTYNTFLKNALYGRSYRFLDDPVQIALDELEQSLKTLCIRANTMSLRDTHNGFGMRALENKESLTDLLRKLTKTLNTDATKSEIFGVVAEELNKYI